MGLQRGRGRLNFSLEPADGVGHRSGIGRPLTSSRGAGRGESTARAAVMSGHTRVAIEVGTTVTIDQDVLEDIALAVTSFNEHPARAELLEATAQLDRIKRGSCLLYTSPSPRDS